MHARRRYARSTLSHLARRHLRYFSAFDCTEHARAEEEAAAAAIVQETPLAERMARVSDPQADRAGFVPWSALPLTNRSGFRFALAADFAPAPASSAPEPTPPQVCLLFKDDLYEEWVAGLNASDGLTFHGDPHLVSLVASNA